jgi:hypothetical protein
MEPGVAVLYGLSLRCSIGSNKLHMRVALCSTCTEDQIRRVKNSALQYLAKGVLRT